VLRLLALRQDERRSELLKNLGSGGKA
jgi:hypothetical protein